METHTSKLTSKGQTTVPQRVRRALGLHTGDLIAFRCAGNRVELAKARPMDLTFAEATAGTLAAEWSSAEDEDAFREL